MSELPSPVQRELGHEATVQKETTQVSAFTLLLALAVILLAIPPVGTWYYGKTIYYITDHGPGLVEPNHVPDGMALDYATRWIETRHTYTPETYQRKMADVKAWLHPKLRLPFKKQTEEEYREVLKRQQSSQASIAEDGRRLKRRDGPLLVIELVGIRSVFVGGEERPEPMRTEMTLMPYFADGYDGRLIVARERTIFGEERR